MSVNSAGVMCFDASGNLLIVNPTYKAGWNLPGGRLEPGETFSRAARREAQEELGIAVEPGPALVVACVVEAGQNARTMVVFDGGELSTEQQAGIVLQESELSEYRFVPADADASAMVPPHLARILRAASRARDTGTVAYLEVEI